MTVDPLKIIYNLNPIQLKSQERDTFWSGSTWKFKFGRGRRLRSVGEAFQFFRSDFGGPPVVLEVKYFWGSTDKPNSAFEPQRNFKNVRQG